jgi:hypothetical protein
MTRRVGRATRVPPSALETLAVWSMLHRKISLNCGARWLDSTVMPCLDGSSCAKEM